MSVADMSMPLTYGSRPKSKSLYVSQPPRTKANKITILFMSTCLSCLLNGRPQLVEWIARRKFYRTHTWRRYSKSSFHVFEVLLGIHSTEPKASIPFFCLATMMRIVNPSLLPNRWWRGITNYCAPTSLIPYAALPSAGNEGAVLPITVVPDSIALTPEYAVLPVSVQPCSGVELSP